MFILSIGTSLFKVYHCVSASPIMEFSLDFSIHLLISAKGHFVTIKTSQDEYSFGKTLFRLETTYVTQKEDFFFWQGTNPQMGPTCSKWYSQ